MLIMLTALLAGASPCPRSTGPRWSFRPAPKRCSRAAGRRPGTVQPRGRPRTTRDAGRPPAHRRPRTPARSSKASTPPARGPVRVAAAAGRAPRSRALPAGRRRRPRRVSGGGPLDLAQITTICRAAGNQDDPAGFLARLSSAYSLSSDDSVSLRASCAAYLAGRADARRASGGTY